MIEMQVEVIEAMATFQGWSICVSSDELGETEQELYERFGVDDGTIDRLGLSERPYFADFFSRDSQRNRKRDRALETYHELFKNGHEAEGESLKEATNEVSDALGQIVSVDTMRRALSKKK